MLPDSIDLSFMYSLKCSLDCPFCMYSASPEAEGVLDLAKVETFLNKSPNGIFRSFGFYGGEVEENLEGYSAVRRLLREGVPLWVITNGAWSSDIQRVGLFLQWCVDENINHVKVSGTPHHRQHQDLKYLRSLQSGWPHFFALKGIHEDFLPMGKLEGAFKHQCSKRCRTHKNPTRIAIRPDGVIIYQSCDGIYPVIGNIEHHPKEVFARAEEINRAGCFQYG